MAHAAELQGISVLVIDDSATIRRSVALCLAPSGCELLFAEDGFAALALLAQHRPRIVLCDVEMPRLDGHAFCSLLKTDARYCRIPVILLSAGDGVLDRARARIAGADLHLSKPFDGEQLPRILAACLRRAAHSSDGADPVSQELFA